ncbi:MAG TPA: DNA methyltransferase, partial [Polyangiaceae bacterium]|nr:DNA methyltransferase [Polyangiaceae bacterium]
MSDLERQFHETWLGMVQPAEGLVVSVPVLEAAQCMQKQERQAHEVLRGFVHGNSVADLPGMFAAVLELSADQFDTGEALPKPLRLYVAEGKQELKPTRALKRRAAPQAKAKEDADLPAAALAGRGYLALVWEVPAEVDLDKPETVTGPWLYPAQAKFDRLLRECRVPIGLLSNGRELHLIYAPHGESSGFISFRMEDMASVGGRPIFDAFVMLLGRTRWFGVSEDQQLPALLERSRREQAGVTNELSDQVFEALEELLAGFSAAAERDPQSLLLHALKEESDGHVYSGLLTVLLRLVFTLYCEDRGLLPTDNKLYAQNYSVLGLYDDLSRDHGRYPDSMDRRFGAYPRLVSLFRAIYLGVSHGDLQLPPRHGDLFNPHLYAFLEGRGAGSAPITEETERAAVALPAISDGTVYRVLHKLIVLGGQRISYRALDVEQIGSVYEALMGFDVERLVTDAVRIKLSGKSGAASVWLEAQRLLEQPAGRRVAWLCDELGFDKGTATKIDTATKAAKNEAAALTALEALARKKLRARAGAESLVIQPGPERRRTSSHYTPRSLSEPIVKKTLDPLIRAMGDRPRSEALLNLVICDPAVGSGAFLVAACRYLADHVVAAWTRESFEEAGGLPGIGQTAGSGKTKLQLLADAHEDVVNHARRLVAQRCLYGVDKNPYAVQLARLSLWLVTMAKKEPFTFVDHAIRHGDSLVGLNFDQIRAFHWKTGQKGEQLDTTKNALQDALNEAIGIRQQIQSLAADGTPETQREKERLLRDAEDATDKVRLIADLVVGAFFAGSSEKEREKERVRRRDLVQGWLGTRDLADAAKHEAELRQLQAELRQQQVPFHWMIEFPEVFYLERPDPLDSNKVNGTAMVEAFVGNPPFAGNDRIVETCGPEFADWLREAFPGDTGTRGNCDLCAYFFRRAESLLGSQGTFGLIATNTIGQGDSRKIGLKHLLAHGIGLYAAQTNLPWPGEAAVTVSVVFGARGVPLSSAVFDHDGQQVTAINSRLRPSPERPDPQPLRSNDQVARQGTIVLGDGFVIAPDEYDALIKRSLRNRERLFPFLGGQEVNTSPTGAFERYVISFGTMDLSETERWPDLREIVERRVRPFREQQKGNNSTSLNRKKYWWRFDGIREELYAA